MKYRIFLVVILLLIFAVLVYFFKFTLLNPNDFKKSVSDLNLALNNNQTSENSLNSSEAVTVIVQNLDTPWAIAFLPASPSQGGPDKSMLVTERNGKIRFINSSGNLEPSPIATISDAREIGEGGLLGIALHPDFSSNNFIYLYYTYSESGGNTLNRVVRMTLRQAQGKLQLNDEKIILDKIPGAANHNGGRIKFGPDNFLYITTGDAQNPSLAQSRNSLAGKLLRVTDSGEPAPGNPFGNLIYSYGHRNPQGITWDGTGRLWETEHGQSATDEINLIEAGKNYGWPTIRGDETKNGLASPIAQSGSDTWAPGGATYLKGSVFFAGLRGQALYEAVIQNNQVVEVKEHFKGQFGRIREVILGPDRMIYITTSNLDGRGTPDATDDRVIRINPEKL